MKRRNPGATVVDSEIPGSPIVGHRESFEAMNRCIAVNKLEPIIDTRFHGPYIGFGLQF